MNARALPLQLVVMAPLTVQVSSALTGVKLLEVQTGRDWTVRDLEEAVLQGSSLGVFVQLLKGTTLLRSDARLEEQVGPGELLAAVFRDSLQEKSRVLRAETVWDVWRTLGVPDTWETPSPGWRLLCSGSRLSGDKRRGFNPRAGSRLVNTDLQGLGVDELEAVLLQTVKLRGFVDLRFAPV